KSLAKEANESLAKHKALELEIERLLSAVKLENENVELKFQVSDQKDIACGTSANTKFRKQSILGKPPKVGETHALSKPVTSNSITTPQGSKVMKNVKVIAPRMFRINPFKSSREEKHVPNKVRANLQTELERTKECFENYIIKKETEYAKLWNDWYKKCNECKYDKISYDKAYKDMQQKIERLQAQLGDLKGKSKDTSCVSNTLNPLSRKLKNANVELEFQVLNYARENAHLKATYKNLFDSIFVSHVQTKTKIASLQNELQCNIYKNAKLRTQLFKKVSDQKDNTQDSSKNTKFAKQPNVEILPKIVTSNSVSTPRESKGVNNAKVIAPGMFRISPYKISRDAKKVPNTVSASSRTKPITVSQPSVITKKDMNSNLNGLSSTGLDNTKTRRPQPRCNTKNDKVPSASKSSRSKNKEVNIEEHHRNLLLSKKNKHISSGKSTDNACVSDTQNQLFQKVKNANVELEFQ
nr:hypothetical protein [Tanacetum cinerariifolium]